MNNDFFPIVPDSRSEILDLQFILTDLVEISVSEVERGETAYFDAMTLASCQSEDCGASVPLGKMVC